MRAEDLVFWLDVLRPHTDLSSGALCGRHADSMVVPRHWTLDDLRDPEPHLFRPPTPLPAPSPPTRRRSRPVSELVGEQMTLVAEPITVPTQQDGQPEVTGRPAATGEVANEDVADVAAIPWTPSFDDRDDLDGLLSARSPLLARAFRGDDRPRPG